VRFHDGSPLTAADVVYSIERLRGDETLLVRSQVSGVTSAAAGSGHVVLLRTAWPSARLLSELSQVPIVRAGSRGEALEARANGTGPYEVESWVPGQRLRLRRHESYWGPRPALPRVDVEMAVSDERAAAGLLAGRVSLAAHIVSGHAPRAEAAAAGNHRLHLVSQPSLFLRHLGFDLSSPTLPGSSGLPNPYRRRDVRQAFELALDRTRLASVVSPTALAAHELVPRLVFGHAPGRPAPARDVARAVQLLQAAGYRGGLDVTLLRPRPDRVTEELKSQLAEAGIRVTLLTPPTIGDYFAALRRREAGLWIAADGCLTGDAGGLLSSAFHSPDPARSLGLENYGGYADAGLDRVIEQADTIFRPNLRLPVLQNAVRQVEDELVWIPLYYGDAVFIVDRTLDFKPRADLLLRYAEIGAPSR
jgi:peptide/nickel transport system substrate-binding protein